MITAEHVREILRYNKSTGEFVWRVDRFSGRGMKILKARKGDRAGYVDAKGYLILSIDGKKYKAHRIAWMYVTGSFPIEHIDHRDGVRLNNRFANLRDVSRAINGQNQRSARRGSSSGLIGVSFRKRKAESKKPWFAQIGAGGLNRNLGTYATKEEAHAAYLAAKRKLHKGCTI